MLKYHFLMQYILAMIIEIRMIAVTATTIGMIITEPVKIKKWLLHKIMHSNLLLLSLSLLSGVPPKAIHA